jgi:hypothetical protein
VSIPADGSAAPELPKILYIAGWQRSGTTILDRVLGQLEGFVSTGELRMLWEASLREGYLCGCGEPLAECPFWRRAQVAGGLEGTAEEWRGLAALQRRRMHARPAELRAIDRAGAAWAQGEATPLDAYARARLRLYAGVRAVTGAEVVVDSSKHPADAHLLSVLPGVDLYVVHLIRDPRAVAHSWRRRIADTADPGGRVLDGFGVLRSTVWWLAWNAAIERRLGGRRRYLRVRYEDFVERPAEVVGAIATLVGEPRPPLPLGDGESIGLGPDHAVSGNPRVRSRQGAARLRADDEWRRGLPSAARAVSTVAAAPLLHRYGYRLGG